MKLNAGTPPETVKLIAPSLPPLYETLVVEPDRLRAFGSVIVTEVATVHWFASVAVTE